MSTVLLVRHGETPWNRARRLQGWAPVPLSDRGRDQARALGVALAEGYTVDRVTTSDLRRARETADLLAEPLGLAVTEDPAWRERDFGVLQGLTYDAFDERHPEYSLSRGGETAVDRTPERGESLADLHDRVLNAWERLLTELVPDETHVVVTHGGPLYLVLGRLAGRDVIESVVEYSQANAALNEVRVTDADVELLRENETALWQDASADRP